MTSRHLPSYATPPPTPPPAGTPYVLLDDNTGTGAPSALYTDPVEVVRADTPAEVPAALARIEAAAAHGLHAAGFFGYELGYVLEPRLAALMPVRRSAPLLWTGLFPPPRLMTGAEVEAWLAARAGGARAQLTGVALSWDEAAYRARFDAATAAILAGDIYQLNLTFRVRFQLEGPAVALYRALRERQRVAYGGIVETGDLTILSASPELFVERAGGVITTRPMKGTSARGADPSADAHVRAVLASDPKQRAENLMIVDLMRNDLGRIAEVGSVEVTDLFTVETFRTLHQMTSGVRATLRPDTSLATLLAAIFPPGSVTGAPKIRAMELIAALEDSPRGVYCGAVGRISPDGHALFNVAIRTPVFFPDGSGEMGIGSGVVADSDGGREYAECLLKMRFLDDLVRPFQLIETLLFDPALTGAQGPPGAYWLLDGHMARLARSAAHFGTALDPARVRAALEEAVAGRRDRRWRMRLLVARDGAPTVTATELPPPTPHAIMRYVVSPTRLDSGAWYLAHKTTERQLYDREWQHYHDTVGADEVVYLNERGELAEGSRTSIFLDRGGRLLTPPLTAGVLPGVLRAELLATGRAVEAVLTPDDLATGTLHLGNSVRGLVRAEPLAAIRPATPAAAAVP